MVDAIGTKVTATDGAATRVAAIPPVATVAPTTAAPTSEPTAGAAIAQAGAIAQSMAASAPIDADRVATIKKAIADGRFPILPATIADRLIALKLQWNPHDEA